MPRIILLVTALLVSSALAQPIALSTQEDVAVSGSLEALPDAGVTTHQLKAQPKLGTVVVKPNGAFLYKPSPNKHGADSFTVTSTSGRRSALTTVNVEVTAVNDAPTIKGLKLTGQEDAPINATLAAVDVDGDALSFSIATPPAHGQATIEPTGALSYRPEADFHGADQVTVAVSDGQASATAVVEVKVTPVNDPPLVKALTLETAEDTAASARVEASDVDGDRLGFTLAKEPKLGKVKLASAGALTYTPNANVSGSDTFSISVSDGKASVPMAVSVTVSPVNDPPTAAPLSLSAQEDSAARGTVVGKDIDGDTLSYALGKKPENGEASVDAKTGAVQFRPSANWSGRDGFEIVVGDGEAETTVAVSVTVSPVNDAPVIAAASHATNEDVPLEGQIEASDLETASVTLRVAEKPAHGALTLDAKTGAFKYTPARDSHGDDAFVVSVTDGILTSSAKHSVKIESVNDEPILKPLSLSGAEDSTLSTIARGSDVDGDQLRYSISRAAKHGEATVDAATGAVKYRPAKDFNGQDAFEVSVSDGTASVSVTAAVQVTPVNDAPIASGATLAVDEDAALTATIEASDVDGDALKYQLTAPPLHGKATVEPSSGELRYQPAANYHGSDALTVTVSDGKASEAARVSLTVNPVNDAPTLRPITLSLAEDAAASAVMTAADIDGDAQVYAIARAPAEGEASVDAKTGKVSYKPRANFNGKDSFSVSSSDGALTATAEVNVVVASVNDAPVSSAGSLSTDEDSKADGQVEASDVDGDALTYRLVRWPMHGTVKLDAKAGSYTFAPAANYHGADSFVFEATDGKAVSAQATIAVQIASVNDAPVTRPVQITVAEDTQVKSVVTGSDIDGDPIAFAIARQPEHGTATVDAKTGAFVYKPAADYFGRDAFSIGLSDGTTVTEAEISATVTPVSEPPIAKVAQVTAKEDVPYEGLLAATNPDGDKLTFRLTSTPRLGKAELLDATLGRWRYTSNTNINGDDEVAFEVTDGPNLVKGAMKIRIEPVNDAPEMNPLELSTAEDQAIEGTLTAKDIDGDGLKFAIAQQPASGKVTLVDASKGTFRFEPAKDFNGELTFSATATDGKLVSAAQPIAIRVEPRNDKPVTENVSITTAEDNLTQGTLKAKDIDGDALTYRISMAPTHGSVSVTDVAKGHFTYVPSPDYSGKDSFFFVATDPSGASATGMVSIEVTPVDDVPVAIPESVSAPRIGSIKSQLHGFDRDGKPVTFKIVSQPAAGRVVLLNAKTGDFSYTSEGTDKHQVTFSFVVEDGALTSKPVDFVVQLRSL